MASVLHKIGLGVGVLGVVGLSWVGTAASQPAETSTVTPSTSWQRIREFFRQENEDEGRGRNNGSRPAMGTCLVTPRDGQMLWHRNPVLVWQGYSTVGIRPVEEEDNILWKETVSEQEAGVYQAYYSGEPMELGQTYDWLFYISEGSPAMWFRFQTMEAEQYEYHAAELDALNAELATKEVDENAVVLAQAQYFVDNNLPADALQVVFAVGEPSQELLETREALIQAICSHE
jgi:hypothetical protein